MDFFTKYQKLCKMEGSTPTGTALQLGISRAAVNRWRNGTIPSGEILTIIANHFNVTVDSLINDNHIITDPIDGSKLVKIALFGGDTDVTEEMWDEVKNFASYVKEKHKKNTSNE